VSTFIWLLLVGVVPIVDVRSPLDELAVDVDECSIPVASETSREVGRPPCFVENRGQWPEYVRFLCEMDGTVVSAEEQGIALQLLDPSGEKLDSPGGVLVSISFAGSVAEPVIEGVERQSGTYNYFLGNEPSLWMTGIGTFAGVRYREIQPGIDLVLRSKADGSLKYDVFVAPGADLSSLVMRCSGIDKLGHGKDGELCMETALGPVAHARGASWEVLPNGEQRVIECRERVLGDRSFGFEVEGRDSSLPLVIDPGIVWSTYLGSSGGTTGDGAYAVATGANGDVTVVGYTFGPTFPATPGTFQSPGTSPQDVSDTFVTRLSGTDGTLVYSSIIGGFSNQEAAQAVDLDESGRATVAGYTYSQDFPTTPGAFDTTKDVINHAAFVLRLSAEGDKLLYSTMLEGTRGDVSWARSVCVDRATGSAIVGGWTTEGFPATAGAWSETVNGLTDGFVTRLDPTGSALEWSTYFGGSGLDEILGITLDAGGTVTVTGATRSDDLPTTPGAHDRIFDGSQSRKNVFVTRLDPTGSGLVWSTYHGHFAAYGQNIARDPSGGVFVAGSTARDFQTTPGAYQPAVRDSGTFVSRFAGDGALLSAALIAGPGSELVTTLAVDRSGMPTIAGLSSGDYPTTAGALSTTYNGNMWDGFVTRLDPSLSKLVYSTYVGGSGVDEAHGLSMDAKGRVVLVGSTNGPFPTTPGTHSPTYNGGQTDAFVTTLELYLHGVEPFGDSTPACRGPLVTNVTEMPASGAQDFSFYCSGAPPLSTGWLVLGRERVAPARRLGVDVWVNLNPPVRIIPVMSDTDGYVDHPLSLANATSGGVLAAQFFFRTTAECPGSSGAWCASDAVRVTVQ
jgi:hypothetical protein